MTTSSAVIISRCGFFKKCSFLESLTNEQITKLAGAMKSISFSDGQPIVRQGDAPTQFYIIESGTVKCSCLKSNGNLLDLM